MSQSASLPFLAAVFLSLHLYPAKLCHEHDRGGTRMCRTAGLIVILQSSHPLSSSNVEGVLLHRNLVVVNLFHIIWRGDLGRLLSILLSIVFTYREGLWSFIKTFSITLKRMCIQQFCSAVYNIEALYQM